MKKLLKRLRFWYLMRQARKVKMSEEDLRRQRISLAYGLRSLKSKLTRQDIEKAAGELQAKYPPLSLFGGFYLLTT